MKKFVLLCCIFLQALLGEAQELYPYTEPASNMPSKSISVKLGSMLERHRVYNNIIQRHTPELMFGLNKNWMIHSSATFSDMHRQFGWESVRLYTKWRFLSNDDVHKHFRMAAFAAGSYSRNHLNYNEINLNGDQTGLQAGLIATQLWNKLAISATAGWNEILDKERWLKVHTGHYAYTALHYSLSAGYLLFPLEYTDYNQTNVNLYAELLGSRNINFPLEKHYVDLAPSVQFIFKSTSKLNIGYRFQLAGDIYRLANSSFMVSYEYIFLNALKRRKAER